MSNSRLPALPPAGVSTSGDVHKPIASTTEARNVSNAAPGQKVRAASRRPGPKGRTEEPLQNLEQFRRVDTSSQVPAGTGPVRQDVVEGPLSLTRRPASTTTVFKSVTGEVFTFSKAGKTDLEKVARGLQIVLLALIELEKGGSALAVLDAFKLKLADQDGRSIYPIPYEVMERVLTNSVEEPDESVLDSLQLGESG